MSDGQPAEQAQNTPRLETLAIHAGYTVEPTTKAVGSADLSHQLVCV